MRKGCYEIGFGKKDYREDFSELWKSLFYNPEHYEILEAKNDTILVGCKTDKANNFICWLATVDRDITIIEVVI